MQAAKGKKILHPAVKSMNFNNGQPGKTDDPMVQ